MISKLQKRLSKQLKDRGVKNSDGVAYGLLKKRGQADAKGKLTSKGKKRQKLGNKGRAIDRASKRSGHSKNEYKYNPKTNMASLKK